ncbi:ammonium transporter [Cohaesibacter haloalkalitolerans]|uniref:ammonium transporter n=1 Tax=Cohaesibacter haloalkalitolerans TaxID=1162980 RepID=UPI000E64773E|nr:ammonium transporter [Cohaesibacter haloalkalitolerans]
MSKVTLALLVGAASLVAGPALAQEAAEAAAAAPAATGEAAAHTQYIFNTLLFLIGGFLVMWMAAGFAMLEAGLVRSKNVSMQSMKNVSLYAVAGIMYYLIGYNLMYVGVDGGYIGTFSFMYELDPVGGNALDTGYSTGSDWFFQMVFVATAASVVSGTLAERVKLWPFMIFTCVLTAFIYPIAGSWQWGAGWLSEMGFSDFAGSTLVHSVGGWAALSGVLLLGARKGKYGADGSVNPMPASNIPLATLGTFILWLGWFGFNGASQLAMGTIGDVSDVSRIFANTNMAAAGGVVAAMILLQILYKKVDVTMVLNGALAGLVSITAEPLNPTIGESIVIGAIGAVLVIIVVPLLDKLKIDDVVGAIPVHLVCGIWGTMIVPFTNSETSYVTQFIGVVSYGAFTLVCSFIVWGILKATMGIRVTEEEEYMGLDKAEIGVEAYPEFGVGSQRV